MNKRSQLIERITITGKKEESPAAWKFLARGDDWRIIEAGPLIKSDNSADMTRFKIIAERKKP
jgi:hypothetical protein